MRKLLVCGLILISATMAQGALRIYVNGSPVDDTPKNGDEITITQGQTITLGIGDTVNRPAGYGAYLDFTPISGPFSTDDGQLTALAPTGSTFTHYTSGGDTLRYSVNIKNAAIPSGVHFITNFTCTGEGDITVKFYQNTPTLMDTLTIHQTIPEPMTMSLLGLGGLALLRRRC